MEDALLLEDRLISVRDLLEEVIPSSRVAKLIDLGEKKTLPSGEEYRYAGIYSTVSFSPKLKNKVGLRFVEINFYLEPDAASLCHLFIELTYSATKSDKGSLIEDFAYGRRMNKDGVWVGADYVNFDLTDINEPSEPARNAVYHLHALLKEVRYRPSQTMRQDDPMLYPDVHRRSEGWQGNGEIDRGNTDGPFR